MEHLLPWVPWARPEPISLDEARTRLAGWEAEFEAGESFLYAIFNREETELIGGIGLYGRIGPGALEIGYWVRAERTGHGFATEAAGTLTRTGFSLPRISRIQMHCDPANTVSKRIPEKLGYRLVHTRGSETGHDGSSRGTDVFEMTLEDGRRLGF